MLLMSGDRRQFVHKKPAPTIPIQQSTLADARLDDWRATYFSLPDGVVVDATACDHFAH